jgi:regulator of sirC expression with transglutaminase-like and TPR domain
MSGIERKEGVLEQLSEQLKQAINEQSPMLAVLCVAKHFDDNVDIDDYLKKLQSMVESGRCAMYGALSEQNKFRRLVHHFYRVLAFSGNKQDFFASKYSLISQVIDFRTGIPVSLSLIFNHVAAQLGFNVTGVNFPGHFLIRYDLDSERSFFIDPLNGQFLNYTSLQALYSSVLDNSEGDEMPQDALNPATLRESVVRILNNLKASFIQEKNFHKALLSVELLVHLQPDDPYTRRDRGFLLHQLDCEYFAVADYQYFIEQCPQDPSAQLLKLQIKKLQPNEHVVH